MNKSFLAFTGKLNQERFSANLTLNWSSAVYLKLTIGKRFNLVCVGAIEAVSAMCYWRCTVFLLRERGYSFGLI